MLLGSLIDSFVRIFPTCGQGTLKGGVCHGLRIELKRMVTDSTAVGMGKKGRNWQLNSLNLVVLRCHLISKNDVL